VNRPDLARSDAFSNESNVAPLREAIPFGSVFVLMLLQGLIDELFSPFRQFVGHANPRLALAHGKTRAAVIMKHALGRENNHEASGLKSCMNESGVQRLHAPSSICFGCGPANAEGLQIDSHRTANGLTMTFTPEPHHQAFPGMVNGGIIGTILDCHGNWTAAIALMDAAGSDQPPCTVTASYSVQLRRPTPMGVALTVNAETVELGDDRATVKMELLAEGKVCARGEGLFVAVKEGHPAYHRWS